MGVRNGSKEGVGVGLGDGARDDNAIDGVGDEVGLCVIVGVGERVGLILGKPRVDGVITKNVSFGLILE